MDRLFGRSKPKTPGPTLQQTIAGAESRASSMQKKVDAYNDQLRKLRAQYKKIRPESPLRKQYQQKMLQILRQRKMYENQLMMTQQQAFNMDMQQNTIASLEATQEQVKAMAAGNKAMKAQYKKIDIGKVEDIQFEMEDLMEDANEIQEILSQSFAMPGVDEADLEEELLGLEDMDFDLEGAEAQFDADFAAPESAEPSGGVPAPATATGPVRYDDFGLPIADDPVPN